MGCNPTLAVERIGVGTSCPHRGGAKPLAAHPPWIPNALSAARRPEKQQHLSVHEHGRKHLIEVVEQAADVASGQESKCRWGLGEVVIWLITRGNE
jgi:hypothetical protein